MLTIERLNEFGADTAEGLGRCMNNEAFYFRLIGMVAQDANFAKLKEAMDAGDLTAGFEAAHALKGVLGNLSLTPVYEPALQICELLRTRTETDYGPLLEELYAQKEKLDEMLKE